MTTPQPGILPSIPARGRYLRFEMRPGGDPAAPLEALAKRPWDERVVLGVGPSVVAKLGGRVPGLHALLPIDKALVDVPSTPSAIWCWLRGDDPGSVLLLGREMAKLLDPGFVVVEETDAFRHREGRDLTGYVDGTENPPADRAADVALVSDQGRGIDGGSFVAVQRWVHDLGVFASFGPEEGDLVMGRRLADDVELEDAPATSHVKRTAQESFEPEAFLLRRSMPWSNGEELGLYFVAFGRTLDAFEVQLARMVGSDDGVVDALFRFSRPVTSAAFFCPPLAGGHLDLSAILK